MTSRQEKEKLSLQLECPRCKAPRGRRCRRIAGGKVTRIELEHPHKQRTALVR